MLKRFSSLILALVIGGSVLAGTMGPSSAHLCKMAGSEMMPGVQMPTASLSFSLSHEMMPGLGTMPCCKKHETQSVSSEFGSPEECCFTIPQETGSSGTLNLRTPSFSMAVIHPAFVQSPLAAPTPYECSYSTAVFLPNLQASYIRNHSFLI